jgi:uncharacterized protein
MSLIDPTLAAILVCPACRGDLDEDAERLLLRCRVCGLGYPVRDGLPVMLVDEALRP